MHVSLSLNIHFYSVGFYIATTEITQLGACFLCDRLLVAMLYCVDKWKKVTA